MYTYLKDYDFDYSDGDEADDNGAPDLENMYYIAKCKIYICVRTAMLTLS